RVRPHHPTGDQRDECGDHGDAGARAILRYGTRRDVDVDVVRPEPVLAHALADAPRVRLDPRQRGGSRLLPHVAELAGYLERAVAGEARGLDEQHVAPDRRPREPGRHTRCVRAAADLGQEAALSEQLADLFRADRALARPRSFRVLARDLAAD